MSNENKIEQEQVEYVRNFNDYEKVKFSFKGLEKYIIMELNTKIALEDLKYTFGSILKQDFFAKKLQFFLIAQKYQALLLHSELALNQQRIPKKYQVKQQYTYGLEVRFLEEGA